MKYARGTIQTIRCKLLVNNLYNSFTIVNIDETAPDAIELEVESFFVRSFSK